MIETAKAVSKETHRLTVWRRKRRRFLARRCLIKTA